ACWASTTAGRAHQPAITDWASDGPAAANSRSVTILAVRPEHDLGESSGNASKRTLVLIEPALDHVDARQVIDAFLIRSAQIVTVLSERSLSSFLAQIHGDASDVFASELMHVVEKSKQQQSAAQGV